MSKGKHLRWSLLIKKRLQHRCFSVNIAKFLRTLFFIEHLWWPLLYFKAFIVHMTTYKVYYIIVESYALFLQEQPECMISFLKSYPHVKYSSKLGGSMLKNSEVCILCKQVQALASSAQTLYIFPAGLKPIFKFFLKSSNAEYFIISLNSHSTLILTLLI